MYKRQGNRPGSAAHAKEPARHLLSGADLGEGAALRLVEVCLLYTSDAAGERSSVDLGGRRIIKKKKQHDYVHDQRRNINKHHTTHA